MDTVQCSSKSTKHIWTRTTLSRTLVRIKSWFYEVQQSTGLSSPAPLYRSHQGGWGGSFHYRWSSPHLPVQSRCPSLPLNVAEAELRADLIYHCSQSWGAHLGPPCPGHGRTQLGVARFSFFCEFRKQRRKRNFIKSQIFVRIHWGHSRLTCLFRAHQESFDYVFCLSMLPRYVRGFEWLCRDTKDHSKSKSPNAETPRDTAQSRK